MVRFVIGILLVLTTAEAAWAQEAASAEQQAEVLRAQLREVADKEAELQARARQLEEDLKPENIQRSVALVGTTDAQSLREERRQQLERQKAAVEEQLASLAASRSRLEAAITTAEAEAVRQRAAAIGAANAPARRTETPTPAATPTQPAAERRANPARTRKRVRRGKPGRRVKSH